MQCLRIAAMVLALVSMGAVEWVAAQGGPLKFPRSLTPPSDSPKPEPIEWSLDSDGKYRLQVGFALEFEADGVPTTLRVLPNQHPQATEGLLPQLNQLRFAAKNSQGQTARGATTLWVHLEGTQRSDGKFDMQVSGIATSPRIQRKYQPKYPPRYLARLRPGSTLIEVLVGVDGRAKSMTVPKGVPNDEFARESMRAIALWRFEPERVDGEAVETKVLVPFQFRIAGLPPARLPWEKPLGAPDEAMLVAASAISIQNQPL